MSNIDKQWEKLKQNQIYSTVAHQMSLTDKELFFNNTFAKSKNALIGRLGCVISAIASSILIKSKAGIISSYAIA